MNGAPVTIKQRLWLNGYSNRPCPGDRFKHEIFTFNTMEVVTTASAFDALAAVGIHVPDDEH
jgi:hypothetical protein